MRARLLVPLALLGAIAACWWLLRGAGGEAPDSAAAAGASRGAEAQDLPAPAAVADATELERETHDQAAGAGAAGDTSILLRFVLEDTEVPASGAEVFALDWHAPESAALRAAWSSRYDDRETTMRVHAPALRAAADGTLRVPRARNVLIVARKDRHYADASLRFDSPAEVRVPLRLDVSARVLVRDADGRPEAGAAVAWFAWHGDLARHLVLAQTGADGIAVLPHLQTRFPPDPGARHKLGLMMPGAMDGQVEFRPADPPAEPVELRLPAHGSAIVEAFDADGKPMPDGTVVFVQEAPTAEELDSWSGRTLNVMEHHGSVSALTAGGRAVLPHVGLGLRLEYLVWHPVAEAYFGGEADGPKAPGESVVLVARLAQPPTRIRLRLLRPDRSPLVERRIAVKLVSNFGTRSDVLETDADGAAFLLLNRQWEASGTDPVLFLAAADPGLARILAMRRNLHEPPGPGDHDFGDVVLGAESPGAAGVVVDETGAPLAGVRVSVGVKYRDGAATDDMDLPRGLTTPSPLTGADGAFGLHVAGDASGSFWLHFRKAGHVPASLMLLDGRSDHRIVLPRAARLRGRVLVDSATPVDLLVAGWSRNGRTDGGANQVRVNAAGELTTEDLPAGIGMLRLHSARTHEELARIPDVALSAGEETDPRLDPLDLRGKLHHYRLRVLDPEGRDAGVVGLVWEGEQPRSDSHFPNPVRLLLPEAGRTVSVYAPGCTAARVVLDRPELEVRLSAGRAVELQLEGLDWPQPDFRLVVQPELVRTGGGLDGFEAAFDEQGRARLLLPEAGDYKLHLNQIWMPGGRRKSNAYLESFRVDGTQGRTLHVPDGAPAPAFVIRADQAEWDRQVLRMRAWAEMPEDE